MAEFYLPLLPWQSSPSFQDFIIASERIKKRDVLVLKNGRLEKKCSYEPNEEQLRQATWWAFRRAVIKEFPKIQRNYICARYGFDWNKIAYSKEEDLKRRHIEYFGTGAANPYTFNLKESLCKQSWLFPSLENQSTEWIHRLNEHAARLRFIGKVKDPSKVYGGAIKPHENFIQDQLLTDQRRANLFQGIEELISDDPNIPRLHPYYSRLAMGIVSLLETQKNIEDIELVIPAPAIIDGKKEYYKIHKIISEGGLNAVAFVPVSKSSKLSPILSFRCTKQSLGQADAILSNLNNMEKHIGKSGYDASEEKLCELMKDPAFTRGKKIKVLAYSQGGAHAGYFMRDFWRQVEEFVGFNIVGNDARVVESLANQINALDAREIPPAFYIHRNMGDWVNKSGQKHIGWGIKHPNALVQVIEWAVDDFPAPTEEFVQPEQFELWQNLHAARPMDSGLEDKIKGNFQSKWLYEYNIYKGPTNCNRVLDTYNSDHTIEDFRKKIGEGLYKFVSWTFWILDFALRVFGIDFFKKNS
ncbi:MAG: hypothetical protein K940chlam6_00886 [Chlamydiae bacterium]|nr:hypothetical protein [Chlamydiota bacterium]